MFRDKSTYCMLGYNVKEEGIKIHKCPLNDANNYFTGSRFGHGKAVIPRQVESFMNGELRK